MQSKLNIFLALALLCFIFNIYAFFSFRFKVSSNIVSALDKLEKQNNSYFLKYSVDLISHIDKYLATNIQNCAVSTNSDFAGVLDTKVDRDLVEKSLNYDFYMVANTPVMRIGFQDFFVGDPFPRGGVIHRITYDSVLV